MKFKTPEENNIENYKEIILKPIKKEKVFSVLKSYLFKRLQE